MTAIIKQPACVRPGAYLRGGSIDRVGYACGLPVMERRALLNDLALVEDQVVRDQEQVKRQREIVVELETCGQVAILARQLLQAFEATLEILVCRRRRIRQELVQLDKTNGLAK